MGKLSNRELTKLAKKRYKRLSIVGEIPTSLKQDIVVKALIEMFEFGYRHGENPEEYNELFNK
jgi:hypothetical protein